MEEKTPLSHEVVCSQMLDFGTSKLLTMLLQREPVLTMIYYQPLPITRYQVSFFANNYFE